MIRFAAVILAYGLVLSACSAPPQTGSDMYPERPHELRDTVDAYLRAAVGAGFSGTVLIADGEQVVLREAYSPSGTIAPEDAFWIGSLAKPITAAAILKLMDQGRLSTGDPIEHFIDAVPADKRGITIDQLLTHTSGLPHAYIAEGITDRDQAVGAILALPLDFAPGTDVSYSNDGYSLLAAIVEIAAERPYADYIEQEIFRPAGMAATGFWPGPADGQTIAPVRRMPQPEIARPNWGYRGAAGIYSSADDLHAFTRAFRAGHIISPEAVAVATSSQVDRSGDAADIGYGWFLSERAGRPVITHAGFESGLDHYGWIYIFPAQNRTLVMLSNSPEDLAVEVLNSVLQMALSAP